MTFATTCLQNDIIPETFIKIPNDKCSYGLNRIISLFKQARVKRKGNQS